MARLLIVDDEKSIRFTLSEFMKQDGHDVQTAACVDDALAMLADTPFDIVITDIIMPRVTGVEFMQMIRKASPETQVILITGEPTVETVTEALRAGAFDYLAKPITREAIRHVVSKADWVNKLKEEKNRLELENIKYRDHLEQLVNDRTAALEQSRNDLIHSQNRYLAVLRGTPHGMFLLDENWIIQYGNQAAHAMIGGASADTDELIGQSIRKLFISESECGKFVSECEAMANSVSRLPFEFKLKKSDGSVFWGELSVISYEPATSQRGYVMTLVDISEKKSALEALRKSEERYAVAAQGSNDGLWDWDLTANLVFHSERWYSMLGYELGDFPGDPAICYKIIHPDDMSKFEAAMHAHLAGETEHLQIELRMMHGNGTYRWILMRGMAVRGADGKPVRLAGSQSDITEQKLAEEQLTRLALYDTLTGLSNRALFLDRLNQRLARGRRNSEYHFAIVFADVDRFKKVNDSLGHPVGDKLLKDLGSRLVRILRPGDTIARLGGDEFAILLDDITNTQTAISVCNRLLSQLSEPFMIDKHSLHLTASIGVAMGNESYHTAQDMIRDADTAMYHAKELGRNRFAMFDVSMHARAVRALELEHDIRLAISQNQLEAYYQPIVSLTEGNIIGFESLVRWQHPTSGMISPAEFIPLAEETGLITAIDEWVLDRSCHDAMSWREMIGSPQPHLMMSVNFSALNFSKAEILGKIEKVLEQSQLSPELLHIEITESVLMERWSTIGGILDGIHKLGAKLCLDDFGTGYSSLSYLHDFPIDWLKIDRSFTMRMMDESRAMDIVRTIITLAKSLDMKVVAEGVESAEQLKRLRELDCDYAQGYLFSAPVGEAKIQNLLKSKPQW